MTVDLDENLKIRQGVTEKDVLNDVRRMYSDEHEANVGFGRAASYYGKNS